MQYLKWSSKNILESRTGHANRAFFIIGLKQGLAKYGQGAKSSPPPTFFSNVVLFFFFFFFYFIFKLNITVLDLPNINMNPPQVYLCSPS